MELKNNVYNNNYRFTFSITINYFIVHLPISYMIKIYKFKSIFFVFDKKCNAYNIFYINIVISNDQWHYLLVNSMPSMT